MYAADFAEGRDIKKNNFFLEWGADSHSKSQQIEHKLRRDRLLQVGLPSL
jgi:hypothetical protein